MASLEQLPSSLIDTIIIPVKLFRFIGQEFFDDDKARFKNYCKFTIFVLLSFIFSSGFTLFFIKINETDAGILEIANAIPCFLLVIQSLLKLSLLRKKHRIRCVVYEIAELWPREIENREKKKIMDYWIHRNKIVCEAYFKCTRVGLIIYNSINLVIYFVLRTLDKNPDYVFPCQLYYPFEMDSVWKYVAVYLMQILATTTIYECSYESCDMFLFTLTVDVSMLFRLLQHDLVNINVDRGQGADESLENLKNIVKRHHKLLKLAEDLDEIFGAIMFNVLIFSSLIICFFGFLGIAIEVKFQQCMYLTAAIVVLFSVFYIMLPGQILSDTSSGVASAAYQTLWYNSDQRFRKIIVIIMSRSQKPCKLRAMGYADVNLETFYKICGTTWSYLSVVNQMYQKSL
ncbi:odorant receptor 67a-like [Cydia splendana]|uniref:odorant receptor 67a-like n=1 Tax=Cydia splendana TaxID=1100963 RepID=UPI00213FF7FF